MSDEQAKAVQEVAKTSGQLIEASQKVGSFISRIVGGASNQLSGILEDSARFYRYKNLLNISDKVEAIHTQRRIVGKSIPITLRLAIPMLDSATLEDDETLQEVWATLIANSTDPNFKEALHPGYVEIIKQMSPDEAIILDSFLKVKNYSLLFSNHVSQKYTDVSNEALRYLWMGQKDKSSYEIIFEMYLHHCKNLNLKKPTEARIYIDNLLRLRIVELGHDFSGEEKDLTSWLRMQMRSSSEEDKANISAPARDEYLKMTSFGQSFVAACINENA